jgi:hypothetical protein
VPRRFAAPHRFLSGPDFGFSVGNCLNSSSINDELTTLAKVPRHGVRAEAGKTRSRDSRQTQPPSACRERVISPRKISPRKHLPPKTSRRRLWVPPPTSADSAGGGIGFPDEKGFIPTRSRHGLWPEMRYILGVAAVTSPPKVTRTTTHSPQNKSADVVGSPFNIRR